MKSKVKLSRGRRYTEAERLQAIRLVRAAVLEGRGLGAVVRIAEQLGYGSESVRGWVRQADIDDGVTAGLSTGCGTVERVRS